MDECSDHDGLVAELDAQLEEQRSALQDIEAALAASPEGDGELAEMGAAVAEGIAALEASLVDMRKAALLAQVDAMAQAPRPMAPDGAQPQPQASTSSALPVTEGAPCSFRYTDGRWYAGIMAGLAAGDPGACSVRFAVPLHGRPFMLQAVRLPAALVQPAAAVAPAREQLLVGSRLLARQRHWRFFERAEVVELDPGGRSATVVFVSSGQRASLPLQLLALSAHAPDGAGSGGSGSGSDGEGAADGGGSESGTDMSLSSEEGRGSGDGEGEEGGTSGADEAEAGEGDAEEEGHWGLGLADVMDHARAAAEAGPQTDTAHFADWEAHSRGIASRLLASMGYQRGAGLGRSGQGLAHPLDLAVQAHKQGLGHAKASGHVGGPRRRKHGWRGHGAGEGGGAEGEERRRGKRGGERARRSKHRAARQRDKEAARDDANKVEMATGDTGVFAFLNSALGGAGGAPGAANGAAPGAGGGPAAVQAKALKEDRQGLMGQADLVAKAQERVALLEAALSRNRGNRQLEAQVQAKLQAARSALAAAQGAHARMSRAISQKDDHKKWLKF